MDALIVDDEKYVRALIRHLIDWQALGIKIVGEASDGIQALQMIERYEPEIVIIDVKMPRLSGLEVIRITYESNRNTKFLVISGHKNFEYAQAAIKYRVENYLVKPIAKDELYSNIMAMQRRIREEATLQEGKDLTGDVGASEMRKEKLLMQLLQKNSMQAPTFLSLEHINEIYGTSFYKGFFNLMAIQMTPIDKLDAAQKRIILTQVATYCKTKEFRLQERICVQKSTGVYLLINYDHEGDYEETAEMILEYLDKKFNKYCRFSICISQETRCLSEIIPKEVETAIMHRVDLPRQQMIRCGSYPVSEKPFQVNIDSIYQAIEIVNAEAIEDWFLNAKSRITSAETSLRDVHETFEKIDEKLNETLLSLYGDESDSIPYSDDLKSVIFIARTRPELASLMQARILQKVDDYYDFAGKRDYHRIRQAKDYITKHYADNISLQDVATVAMMSPNYFSTLFGKVEGCSYNGYLTKYRMNKAKDLLRNKSIRIADISEMVGYVDAKYFSQVFRKTIGITPSEYRRLY